MIGIKKISKPKKLCKSTIYVWVNIRKSSIDEKSEINIYIIGPTADLYDIITSRILQNQKRRGCLCLLLYH